MSRALAALCLTAAATARAQEQDWTSLLQTMVASHQALDLRSRGRAKPGGACAELAKGVTRSSGEEALPAIQAISDEAYRLSELGDVPGTLACMYPMTSAAMFNHPFAVVASKTNGTSLIHTLIRLSKAYPDNSELQRMALPMITNLADPIGGIELVPGVIAADGLELMFAALERFGEDKYGDVQMMAWAALSDFAHTKDGAAFIANHGGHNEGCRYMMQQMRLHPQPYFAKTNLQLTLKYEILQLVNGMLRSEAAAEYAEAFVDAGLVDQVLYTMQAEDDLRASEDIGCAVLAKIIPIYPPILPLLRQANATERVEAALSKYGDDASDTRQFLVGVTYGQWYPVGKDCGEVLSYLKRAA